ncbi:MAG: aminotransferase class III-fold pyridoxal phosphate-dependent enzyme [Bacteroidota bacterium]|nr:aminotransferase class III-fold pyridoxal phosphate-dependent enzyme [Bacteroidota bacterium]
MFSRAAPTFSAQDAITIAQEHYGITAAAHPLDSYLDQNFRLDAADGKFVLKIANAAAEPDYVAFQQEVLEFLQNRKFGGVPTLVRPRTGTRSITFKGHTVWMVKWLPGRVLAHVNPVTDALLEGIGRFLGRLDNSLAGFEHPQAHRDYLWDIKKAPDLRRLLRHVTDDKRREYLRNQFYGLKHDYLPELDALPHGLIHNDANDHNLLIAGKGYDAQVSGLIDFGDALYGCLVTELAVAATYVMMGRPDPVGAAIPLIRGYHAARPLQEAELALLVKLIQARLCISVVLSAYRAKREPDNAYLRVSEAGAWELLDYLRAYPYQLAKYRWRAACGLEACPDSSRVKTWLEANRQFIFPVMYPSAAQERPVVLDLSVNSSWTAPPGTRSNPEQAAAAWFRRIARTGASIGVGRYNEARLVYTEPHFEVPNNHHRETRTIHLGIDLFSKAGTLVNTPLDGYIVVADYCDEDQGYGGLIIIMHGDDEFVFYTLYGHLSHRSVRRWNIMDEVHAGQDIARLGTPKENGGWIPHLHFQVLADDLGMESAFPGVAAASQRSVWLSLCPDPNLILGIPEDCFPEPEPTEEQILARRDRHIGPNLSMSYRKPLHIVRGYRQYLYDADGRRYLDAVNNVPHVGHSHPTVVRAARRQMPILNTNTRYLHRSLGDYASRLTATMPDPLQVCFFVNSGSEANDLALRLAYAYTQRRHIVVLDGAYHGHLSALIDISPYKFKGPGGEGSPAHVHVAALPDMYRGPHRGQDAASRYAAEVTRIVNDHPDRIAAFISESMLGCGGQVELPQGYLQSVYTTVRKAGGICIADEVQVGFGRLGTHFWGFETQHVVPDIVVLGKPMGNGHPLAGVVTTPAIAQAFDNGMEFFSTFGGNSVSVTVGMAVLDVIAEERLQHHALQTGDYLMRSLRQLQERFAIIGDVRGRGLFVGIELVTDRSTRTPAAEEAGYVANRLAELGVLVSTDGPDNNVIKIKPPLVFDQDDADELVTQLERVLREDFVRR